MNISRPKLLLADDHRMLTEALTAKLSEKFDVLGAFESGRELLEAFDRNPADAVVLDISMPGMNGLETARRVAAKHPKVCIIILTMHSERPYVDEALRCGATAFVLKREAASSLVRAIESALSGVRYVSPSAAQPSPQFAVKRDKDVLTARQREVLQMIAEGKSSKQMANALKISSKTVEFHKAGIMDRLGLRTTAELTRYALSHLISG